MEGEYNTEAVYNFSKLLSIEELDAQKYAARFKTKDAFFAILHRFTLDVRVLLNRYQQRDGAFVKAPKMADMRRDVARLSRMLAEIGAVGLIYDLQRLNSHLESRETSQYLEGLAKIFAAVGTLCEKIKAAERTAVDTPVGLAPAEGAATGDTPDAEPATGPDIGKRAGRPRPENYEKLLILIDNFEFESAINLARLLAKGSYSPEADALLQSVIGALTDFHVEAAQKEARQLAELVRLNEEKNKSTLKSILAVDDMPDVLRTVKAMLKGRFRVFGVTDYQAAIKFMRSNTVDLLLMDIEMPGIDGFAMVQLFRQIPEYAHTPFVFLTSNVSDEYVRTAVSLGARGFIKKPVDVTVLVKKLEEALAER